MYADDEARMILTTAGGDPVALDRLLSRRCGGEPLELVVGFADFAGVRVNVEPGVFVPRRRSAHLVDIATDVLRGSPPRRVVVDFGCGSGGLMLALLARADFVGYAVDNDPVAVRCAERNLEGTSATVALGDSLASLPAHIYGRITLVLANLPYVPTGRLAAMPREARLYEPMSALDGGPDGLVPMRRALTEARNWLSPGGSYLCELAASQLAAARAIAAESGFTVAAVNAAESLALLHLRRPRTSSDRDASGV